MSVRDEELARGRAAVAEWRKQNPDGTADELVGALGGQYRPDFEPVLRGMLFAVDWSPGPPLETD